MQTARSISRGTGEKTVIRKLSKLTSLVRPEARINHRAELMKLAKLTNEQILAKWIGGEIGENLVYTPLETVQQMARYLQKGRNHLLRESGKRVEVITHDSTMAAFAYIFLGIIPKARGKRTAANPSLFDYLEAMELALGPKNVRLRIGRRWYDITEKFNEIAQKK